MEGHRSRVRVVARAVSFRHIAGVDLFGPLDFALEPGVYGLVGANGAGKTTLLGLIAGLLRPDEGRIVVTPGDAAAAAATVVLCPQEVDVASVDVAAIAARRDREAQRLRARFALAPDEVHRWSCLSPGERKRWQLAAAFARGADVLLLDEPTNHLDEDGRDCLVRALAEWQGVAVVVSHDRALLDEATTATLHLAGGRMTTTALPYGRARAAWEAERAATEHARDVAKRRLREATVHHAEERTRARSAARGVNAGRRMKSIHNHDATGGLASGLAARAAKSVAQSAARAREAMEARAAELAHVTGEPERTLGRSLFVDWARPPREVLVQHDGDLQRGTRRLAPRLARVVTRATRLHVAGPNGAGKTTLLESLAARWSLPRDRLLTLPQEIAESDTQARIAACRALAPDARGRVLALVAALGVAPAVVLRGGPLSPGEARKLALAFGLGQSPWLVLLDEPTNHLDLPAIERLEEALAAYPGALVLATHDEALATATTTERLDLAPHSATMARRWAETDLHRR